MEVESEDMLSQRSGDEPEVESEGECGWCGKRRPWWGKRFRAENPRQARGRLPCSWWGKRFRAENPQRRAGDEPEIESKGKRGEVWGKRFRAENPRRARERLP